MAIPNNCYYKCMNEEVFQILSLYLLVLLQKITLKCNRNNMNIQILKKTTISIPTNSRYNNMDKEVFPMLPSSMHFLIDI